MLFPERRADCSELTALDFRNSSTLRLCRLKLPKLLIRSYYAPQESYEARTTLLLGFEYAVHWYNKLLLSS